MAQLDRMSTQELRELSARIETEIKARKRRSKTGLKPRAAAAKRVKAAATKSGGRANGAGRASSKSRVLYRNPADPSMTWAGRGRKPKWLAKAANIERYRVR